MIRTHCELFGLRIDVQTKCAEHTGTNTHRPLKSQTHYFLKFCLKEEMEQSIPKRHVRDEYSPSSAIFSADRSPGVAREMRPNDSLVGPIRFSDDKYIYGSVFQVTGKNRRIC